MFNSQDEELPKIHKLLEPILTDQGHFPGKKKKKRKSLDYSYHKARGENCTVKQYIYIYRTIESKQNKIKIKYP